jgi:DNA-binding protein H-NS
MAKLDLQKLTLRELIDLVSDAAPLINAKRGEAIIELRQMLSQQAEAIGVDPDLVFAAKTKKRSHKTTNSVVVKYRNPKNHKETWSGRGRRPRWLVQNGLDLKDCLIQ